MIKKLLKVYDPETNVENVKFLYHLLAERPPIANISHQAMPTFEQHCEFVRKRPYGAWMIVMMDGQRVGAVYLTPKDEIGIHILPEFQGKGLATWAIHQLMERCPRDHYLANIAPANKASIRLFQKLGFTLARTEENQNVYVK